MPYPLYVAMRTYSSFLLSHFLEGCFPFIPVNYSTLIIPSTLPSSKGLQTTVQNPINTSKSCETYQWPYYWLLNYGIRQLSSTVGTDFRFIKINSFNFQLFLLNNIALFIYQTNINSFTDYVLCLRFRNLLGYKMPHTILFFGYYPYSTFIIDKLAFTNSL